MRELRDYGEKIGTLTQTWLASKTTQTNSNPRDQFHDAPADASVRLMREKDEFITICELIAFESHPFVVYRHNIISQGA